MERPRSLSCAGRLRAGDGRVLAHLIPDIENVFKGHYLGSLPAEMPADPSQIPPYVAGLLRSMSAFQSSTKAVIGMSKTQLGCIDASTHTSLQLVTVSAVIKVLTGSDLGAAVDVRTVALVSEDTRNSISVCHAFTVKPKYFKPFITALKAAGCGEDVIVEEGPNGIITSSPAAKSMASTHDDSTSSLPVGAGGTTPTASTSASNATTGVDLRANTSSSSIGSSSSSGKAPRGLRRSISKVDIHRGKQQARGVRTVVAAHFLGDLPVKQKTGDEPVRLALKTLRGKKKPVQVALVIVDDALKVVNTASESLESSTPLKNVSYVTVCEEGAEMEIFAAITVDERLDTTVCSLFLCERGVPDRLCQAFGAAIEVALRQEEVQQGSELEAPTAIITAGPAPTTATAGVVSTGVIVPSPSGPSSTIPAAGAPSAPPSAAHPPQHPPAVDPNYVPPKTTETLGKLLLDRVHLAVVKVLGSGQFGQVYLANLTQPDSTDLPCAVKKLRVNSSQEDMDQFLMEAEVMGVLQHPNLVRMIGACVERRPWLVVLELMQYGDLKKVLQTCKPKGVVVNRDEMLHFAQQVCAGLRFVAEKGYVHMDVAARNVLVHTDNLVKLSDFGLTQPVNPATGSYKLDRHLKLAVRWMPKETLSKAPLLFSERTDSYAFGVLLWEIFSGGEMPYGHLQSVECKQQIVAGAKLSKPEGCDDDVFAVMQRCWHDTPAERPTFAVLENDLKSLRGSLPVRDIGSLLNAMLTQNLRQASMRASTQRKSMRVVPTAGAVVAPPRLAAVAE